MSFTVTVAAGRLNQTAADVVIIPLAAKQKLPESLPTAVRRNLQTELRKVGFTGKAGTAQMLPVARGVAAAFVAVVGLGEKSASVFEQAEGLRRGLGRVVQEMNRHRLRTLAVDLTNVSDPAADLSAAIEAAALADYRLTEYTERLQKEARAKSLRKVIGLVSAAEVRNLRQVAHQAQAVMAGVALARDLVNRPAADVPPEALVTAARAIAKANPAIQLTVLNRKQAAAQGWRAFLAVAKGSDTEPYVIHLTYKPKGDAQSKVVLVGKGITFDSGGLSIKPAQHMEDMKIDMAGAAAVLGLFSVLPEVAPPIEVHGIIATCENMISGQAYRPGDVVRAKNGKTIEILNTDAEGRVTLADALSFAVEQKPEVIIDLATLTGACMVALGETYAGLFGNNQALADQLLAAAKRSGEGLASLPMPEEYHTHIESRLADLKNSTSNHPYGGAITAALFLEEFVAGVPWAHLDIAGPSYVSKPLIPYWTGGATGYGVRTLVEFLRNYK